MIDLEMGADIGPGAEELELRAHPRRSALDLYSASLMLEEFMGWDLLLGRSLSFGVLGLDAVDGLHLENRGIPYLRLKARGGLSPRRGWSNFGPDILGLEGGWPERRGYRLGFSVASRGLEHLNLEAAWRKEFDEALRLEESGAAARLKLWRGLEFGGTLRYERFSARFSELSSFLSWRGAQISARGAWARRAPVFDAESIWSAFQVEPHDDLQLQLRRRAGPWSLGLEGGLMIFPAGEAASQRPGALNAAVLGRPPPGEPEPLDDEQAYELGLRLSRQLGELQVGAELKSGEGYGGRRRYGDLSLNLPLFLNPGAWRPARLKGRLGLLYFSDEPRREQAGTSGWGLLALDWPLSEHLRLDSLLEGHLNDLTGPRLRASLRLSLKDIW